MIDAANPVFALIASLFKLRMRLEAEILVLRHEPRTLQRRRAVASDGMAHPAMIAAVTQNPMASRSAAGLEATFVPCLIANTRVVIEKLRSYMQRPVGAREELGCALA
jgi:hypothetical protein